MSKRYRGEELPKISTQKSALCGETVRNRERHWRERQKDRRTKTVRRESMRETERERGGRKEEDK